MIGRCFADSWLPTFFASSTTRDVQAIAVAPRGKRAMELLNITVGAMAMASRS